MIQIAKDFEDLRLCVDRLCETSTQEDDRLGMALSVIFSSAVGMALGGDIQRLYDLSARARQLAQESLGDLDAASN